MANIDASSGSVHPTLTASTEDVVSFGRDYSQVEVLSRGTADIYFTVDGATPTVKGAGTQVCTAGSSVTVNSVSGKHTTVRLISAAVVEYSVRAG
jgi:hypothetical protein